VGGLDFLADLTGALYAPDYRALLVADLHFEKGSSVARHGVHLPPYDTRATLAAVMAAVERHRPERLLALGDSFHDRARAARRCRSEGNCQARRGRRCDVDHRQS
jgi:uncharacterized protein